jgi:hypothetical protein
MGVTSRVFKTHFVHVYHQHRVDQQLQILESTVKKHELLSYFTKNGIVWVFEEWNYIPGVIKKYRDYIHISDKWYCTGIHLPQTGAQLVSLLQSFIFSVLSCVDLTNGCETWSLALRRKHRLRMFENTVLRIFGPKTLGNTE